MKYTFAKIQNPNVKIGLFDGMMKISKTGRIGLGRQFTADHEIDADTSAYLYWDSDNSTLAISFAPSEGSQKRDGKYAKVHRARDGFTVAFVNGDAGYINASGFFKALGLDATKYVGHYLYEILNATEAGITDAGDKAFVLELGKPPSIEG